MSGNDVNRKIITFEQFKMLGNRANTSINDQISNLAGLTSSGLTEVNSRIDSLYDYFQNALDDLATEILSGDISVNLGTDSGEVITTRNGEIIRMHRKIPCFGNI